MFRQIKDLIVEIFSFSQDVKEKGRGFSFVNGLVGDGFQPHEKPGDLGFFFGKIMCLPAEAHEEKR